MTVAGAAPQLKRQLSPLDVLLLTMSALSPTLSVFIGGNGVLRLAGSGAAIAFIIGGVFSAIFTLLYAEIAAAFPGAGGTYPSLTRLLGPRISFPYVMISVTLVFPSLALSAVGLGDYGHVLLPAVPEHLIAVAGIGAAVAISIINLRQSAVITGVFLALEMLVLGVVAALAISHPVQNLLSAVAHPQMLDHGALRPTPLAALALASVSGIWASAGGSWALSFAEDMVDAQRRIGRVVAWTGVIAAATIAIPMIWITLAIGHDPHLLAAKVPIAAFVSQIGGSTVNLWVNIGVVVAIFNHLIVALIGSARYLFATARDGVWPRPVNQFLLRLHPRFHSPIGAALVLGGLTALCAFAPKRALLVLVSGWMLNYLLIPLAVMVGRRTGQTGRWFRAPLHPAVPVIGIVVMIGSTLSDWLDAESGRPSMMLIFGAYALALGYYQWHLARTGKPIVLGGSDLVDKTVPQT